MNIAYLFFEAKQLIDNFCVSTYGEHADFSDLKKNRHRTHHNGR